MTQLYLVRHGETQWNSERRFQGRRDVPLGEAGRWQAEVLGARLRTLPFHAAYTSDLQRAAATAAIILDGRGIVAAPRIALREAGFGVWEGLTYAEVSRLYPEQQEARRARPAEVAPDGGERLGDLLARVSEAVECIVRDHPEQRVLIVTHGGPLRVLLGSLLGLGLESYWKIRIDNCSLSIVDTYPEGAILSLLNDTSHLGVAPETEFTR